MTSGNHTSLGVQVTNKISAWILILIVAIITAIFLVSFFLSRQMFNKQVDIWKTIVPQYAVTNLIDSDYFSIKREIGFIKSTGLFSSFVITDNQKQIISKFGNDNFSNSNLIPIQDEAKITWGYYYFEPNFFHFFYSFLVSAFIFLILVLALYFIIRGRIRSHLRFEFSRFNHFLKEIEQITVKLHQIYNEDEGIQISQKSSYNLEQLLINNAISRLLEEIRRANKSLREAVASNEQKRFQEELTKTALQVAHDIGSPLAVLEAVVQSTSITQESNRVSIRNAANRIRDISYSFLKKAKGELMVYGEEVLTQQLIQSLINQVLSEKRLQHAEKININFELTESSYGLFALIRATDFCRVLSNIINNSIEAIEVSGFIKVSLFEYEHDVLIQIDDNGIGIPSSILARLGELGVTYGKPQGMGIGLHHAKNTIENIGGKLEFKSKEDKGTQVNIYLPKTRPPFWFVPKITLTEGQIIVIIDDDESIHAIWKKRFSSFENKLIKLIHFYTPTQFIEWYANTKIDTSILYLCDYEFIGAETNGIDLIVQLKISALSILVTSRANANDIITNCEAASIKLLPKDMAGFISIE